MAKTTSKNIPRAKKPEEVGVSSEELRAFIFDAKNNGLDFHSMMIIRHGKVAAEWYNEPYNAESPHMMYSVSKSVTAIAVGFAVSEGLLKLEDKVMSFFPDYVPHNPDKNFDNLTIRHLITMTAGKNCNILADKGKIDWVRDYINSKWQYLPGEKFLYVSENIYMLCAILKRVTGMSVTDYLMPRLFEPLGIERPFWETCPMGIEAGGWGLYLKTEDLGKIMLCCLNNGKYLKNQIIPEDFIKEAVTFKIKPNQSSKFKDNRYGYGYGFWQTDTKPECYRADGLFGQYGFVFPELDAIFISTGGIADEQNARDCVWRHFPKAFDDNANSSAEIPASSCDTPSMTMHSKVEEKIDGKLIRVFRHPELVATGFEPSVLPVAVTYMMTEKGKTIQDLVFKFFENEGTFTWNEGKYHNTIHFGMDGQYREDEIFLAGLHFKTLSYAKWTDEKTLELSIRPYETVGKRVFTFKFSERGIVSIKPSGTPSMKDISFYLGRAAAEVIPSAAIVGAAKYVAKLIPSLSEPKHFGIIK